MKKWIALVLSLLLMAAMLCGCGAASDKAENAAAPNEAVRDEVGGTDMSYTSDSTTDTKAQTLPTNQKLVRKVWMEAETEELDTLLTAVDAKISELSGYVENREVYNGSQYSGRRNRQATLTVRIPAQQLDTFIAGVKAGANIVSVNETVENITLTYADTESRRLALETEQTRLLELLAKAESMEDILKIEQRLTDVRTDLEEVTSRLRVFDNMVDYGTVYLTLSEVREYTVVEEPETVWERIGTGFMESLDTIGNIFVELFVFLVVASPFLVPLAAAIVILVIFMRRKRRNKKTEEK